MFTRWVILEVALFTLGASLACAPQAEAPADGTIVPHYDRATGRLEQVTTDRSGDGKIDTWAFMDGPRLQRIELDRDADDLPDRVEYYDAPASPDTAAPFGGAIISRAEEFGGPDRAVVRREFFEGGVLRRVEEDVDADGRVDKWEEHTEGRLTRVDLDVQKRGVADRRLIYGRGGVERIELDPDGDGVFELAPVQPEARP